MPSLGEDRQTFMARVRAALQREPDPQGDAVSPSEPPPVVPEELMRLASRDDDLIAMTMRNVEATGMKPQRCTRAELNQKLGELLDSLDPKPTRVVIPEAALSRHFDVASVLDDRQLQRIESSDGNFRAQFDADVGITDVRCVLAETGTLVMASDASHSRGPSLVPPVHIAIVKASDIVPDMLDFYAGLQGLPPAELPSSIAYVTGPSKTADIEGVLVTGIHGPQAVHVLLVEDA